MFPLLALLPLALAGTFNASDPCDPGHNRNQIGTLQFWSDCNSKTFCSPETNTCQNKGCRKDDFPLGYLPEDDLPPKCARGSFCPDEEDKCLPWLPVDSPCQLNRDDECQAPPDFRELRDETGRGTNFNGSVCLNNLCMWANVTLGMPCEFENTAYIAYGNDDEYIDIVSRDNCRVGLYCDASQPDKVCVQEKNIGDACTADKECLTYNCTSQGRCGKSAWEPNRVGIWVYILVALGIFVGMFGTLFTFYWLHRKQRDIEREKRDQYWREQNAFRQNIMAMRETAEASIAHHHSDSQRTSLYSKDGSESNIPILMHSSSAQRRSQLRDNEYYDETMTDGSGHESNRRLHQF